jgi:tetratricopeptide (TPR) repeat protein
LHLSAFPIFVLSVICLHSSQRRFRMLLNADETDKKTQYSLRYSYQFKLTRLYKIKRCSRFASLWPRCGISLPNQRSLCNGLIGNLKAVGYLSIFALLASSTVLMSQEHHHHGGADGDPNALVEKFGSIHMPISCSSSVQVPFERGVALLHSFWYEEAQKQFKTIAADDPECAMAQWGLAMTQWRPFWDGMPEDRRKAGIVEIDKAMALHPKTDREQRYIAALSGYLHAEPAKKAEALQAYTDAMAALHKAYPPDVEAQAFYGLALAASVGTIDPVGDARTALAVLEPGFEAHPDHPGFAHYIIHTCDNPQLAHEALPAAERYASIAPSSAHALHMPGHIFARLGVWQQDIESNKASVLASEYAEKHHLGGVTHEIHAYEFLLYAYLQAGDDADAKKIVDNVDSLAAHLHSLPDIESDGMAHFITYVQVEFPSIYYLEMHDWKAVLAIPEPAHSIVSTKYLRAWAQAIAAGHLRDAAAADKAATIANQLADATQKEGGPVGMEIAVTQATIKAWQNFAHGRDKEALEQMSVAAFMQDRVGQQEVDIPAREMYADMLLIDDRPAEALTQYQTALELSPNRFNGLYNAGRAAELAGKPYVSLNYYKKLLKVTNDGAQTQRPEVNYVRTFIQRQQTSRL